MAINDVLNRFGELVAYPIIAPILYGSAMQQKKKKVPKPGEARTWQGAVRGYLNAPSSGIPKESADMNKQEAYYEGIGRAFKDGGLEKPAMHDIAVRSPDLDTAPPAPASQPRETEADQGATKPAIDPAPDVKVDSSATDKVVAKAADWAKMAADQREYVKGIVQACYDHKVNPVTLLPIDVVKAASEELDQDG
jgi:hypothetical protein